jgi:hypothetical protein
MKDGCRFEDNPERVAERSARTLLNELFQNLLGGLDKMAPMFTA